MPAAILNFNGDPYMPLELKGTLLRHGLNQSELASAIVQSNGRPLSHAAMALLINWGTWPKNTPAESIRLQTEVWLAAEGVPQAEIDTIWAIDGDDRYRARQPAGVHVGQASGNAFGRPGKPATPATLDIEPLEVVMLSPEAKRHFGLFRDPFHNDIGSAEDVFNANEQRYIVEAMFQTAKHGGILAVIGESGSGKSTLRKMLIERLRAEEETVHVIFPQVIEKSRMTSRHIDEAIILDLAPDERIRASAETRERQAKKLLVAGGKRRSVLLIEEAHDMTIAAIKHLKRYTEIGSSFRQPLSVILVAQPEMDAKLNEDRHPEAREFIRRCQIARLAPLGADLEKYLAHKFARVGKKATDLLTADACDAIRQRLTRRDGISGEVRSRVYPLLVNNLVTLAMNCAATAGAPQISADVIKEAAHVRTH